MATGVAAIDKHHGYLIDTLRIANDALMGESGNDSTLKRIANDLLGYAIMHFETEERLMQRYGYTVLYPEKAKQHIAQHRDFSQRIVSVKDSLREGEKISPNEVLVYLNEWLTKHVLGIDRQLGDFLVKAMSECDKEYHH
jgi:hemerythrin-like metal-binding protein